MSVTVETARGTVHRWQCDHMGHVNVRAYGEFFEEACWQYYAMIGILPSRLRSGEIHMAAVQQGMKSSGFRGAQPNPYMERSVASLHYNLSRFMGTGTPEKY